jgi:hypothetical protein
MRGRVWEIAPYYGVSPIAGPYWATDRSQFRCKSSPLSRLSFGEPPTA